MERCFVFPICSLIFMVMCIICREICEGKFLLNGNLSGHLCHWNSLIDLGPARNKVDCALRCSRYQTCASFYVIGDPTPYCMGSALISTSLTNCAVQPTNVTYYAKDLTISGPCNNNSDCPIENTVCWDGICACQVGMIATSGGRSCQQGTTNIGGVCIGSANCYGTNVGCWNGKCTCMPGYSLAPATRTCQNGCLVYGTTYSVYRDFTIACPGSPVFANHTVDQCFQECQNNGCVSMRYNHPRVECKTDTCTPLTNPGDFLPILGVDLYIRNCA